MVNYQRFVRRRLINIGVKPNDAKSVAEKFQHEIKHNGPEQAVAYYKRVGDSLLRYLYGTPSKPSWVATTRSGFPKALVALKGYSEEILIRVAKLARVIRLQSVSPRQVKKVLSAPLAPYSGSQQALDSISDLISQGVEHYFLRHATSGFEAIPDRVANHFREMVSTTKSSHSYCDKYTAPPIVESLRIVSRVPVLQVTGFHEAFWPIHRTSVDRIIQRIPEDLSQPVGEIHAAQEGGAKLRMFASPYTVVQCILSPIHNYLDKIRDTIPTDCTKDQMSGALWAQVQLLAGKTVHSVDLSTATCRFPLKPQMDLLRTLGVPADYLEALHWACCGEWTVGKELRVPFKRRSLNWVVGQPLGLKPSMTMFSLAHNLLLVGLCVQLHLEPQDSFRVLGDDVVISDNLLHQAYLDILQSADVPISWNKCHDSNNLAEFAGATISRSVILRPGQWAPAKIESALSIADSLGQPTYKEVTESLALVQEAYLFLDGRFNPPPEKWPLYIKLATSLQTFWLDHFSICDAPLRYDKCRKVFKAAIDHAGLTTHGMFGYDPVGFVYEAPDLTHAAFGSLLKYKGLETYREFIHSVMVTTGYTVGSNRRLASWAGAQALLCLEQAWTNGVLTMQEFKDLGERVIQDVHSLLYLTPPKFGRERMLNRIREKLQTVASMVV